MNTVFIGGSRHIAYLPTEIKKRLDNVVNGGHRVIVGDANGADKAVQKYLLDSSYDKVTVFCSGDKFRNNLGNWHTHHVKPPGNVKGFHFYAAKDREMACEADFGLMIWDGKSPGTVLNVLRLVRAGKKAVIFNVPEKSSLNIKSLEQWNNFLAKCSLELKSDLKERATPEEWAATIVQAQPSSFAPGEAEGLEWRSPTAPSSQPSPEDSAAEINVALRTGDATSIVDAIGNVARSRGMTQISRDTGLARESLYRSLSNGGNPEFVTILKVLASIGICFEARPLPSTDSRLLRVIEHSTATKREGTGRSRELRNRAKSSVA